MLKLINGCLLPKKTSSILYLIAIFLTLSLLISVIPLALNRLSYFGPTDHTSESAIYIYFFEKEKRKIAEKIWGPRIILLGGSGSFFSVRAKSLEKILKVSVVNNALHAGLGIDYLLYKWRQVLRPGDTAVLFFEYAFYFSLEREWTQSDYYLPFDLKYFSLQSFNNQLSMLGKLTPKEYGLRVFDSIFTSAIDARKRLPEIDTHGDLIANKVEMKKQFHQDLLDKYLPMKNMALMQKNALVIADFVKWCRNNGIMVIAGYPAFLDFPEYHSSVEEEFFQSLGDYYKSLGVPVLGDPADFMFSKEMFFDSHYHMHDAGAEKMTDLVARRLEPILAKAIGPVGDAFRLFRAEPNKFTNSVFMDLSNDALPLGIESLRGFSQAEKWGRWTESEIAKIEFSTPLPPRFRLDAKVIHVFGDNNKFPIMLRVGNMAQFVHVPTPNTSISIEFQTDGKEDTIEIILPKPKSPEQLGLSADRRMLGLGFSRINITPLDDNTKTAATSKLR